MKMTRTTLALCLALASSSALSADNSLLFGNASTLSCKQFSALGKSEHDGAISWAMGVLSGWHQHYYQQAIEQKVDLDEYGDVLARRASHTKAIIYGIEVTCKAQPTKAFSNVVLASYLAAVEILAQK
jgi:hypothetical protein